MSTTRHDTDYRGYVIHAYGQNHPHYPPFVATCWKDGRMFNVEGQDFDDVTAKARERIDREQAK